MLTHDKFLKNTHVHVFNPCPRARATRHYFMIGVSVLYILALSVILDGYVNFFIPKKYKIVLNKVNN